jgi:hypothetical protein
MQIQKSQKLECIDGRCPVGVDTVKEIGLSLLEKRAIFFSLKKEMEKKLKKKAEDKPKVI